MKSQMLITAAALAWIAAPASPASGGASVQDTTTVPGAAELRAMTARFAPVDIAADTSRLTAGDRQALAKLVEAARIMDAIFLRQVWSGNDALLQGLARASLGRGADDQARLHAFLINKGPWSRLDEDRPLIAGAPPKPAGANFYPADATKEEIQQWIEAQTGEARAQAAGFFTTIRRDPQRRLTAVPYSLEYQGELGRAAALLREAAGLTGNTTLQRFLRSRADAFLSNDYYASDVAWMELDAPIEPTIGPYEVYEDELFNFKAAFEAFITLRDDEETKKLAAFSGRLQELENALPIDPKHRNPKLGELAPIRVVNVVFTAGDANRGVQTAAFNLPNDERVIKEKGSKRVMLKNVQEAKFRMVLTPIAKVALAPQDQPRVSFDAFFTHILMHELMHGLGPHEIKVDGRRTTVRASLQDAYSAIEEAKADISGLWALAQLAGRNQVDPAIARSMYTTFLASMFRSIRFGITAAHGRGVAIQLNHFLDAGAVRVNPDGTFTVDDAKMPEAVTTLTREIMMIQAEGSYERARALIERLGVVRPPVQAILDKLKDVPVDIEPRFTSAP